MHDPAPASSPVAARPFGWLRGLRGLVLLFLGLALTGFMVLAVAGWLPALLYQLAPDDEPGRAAQIVTFVGAGLLIVTPLILLVVAGRRGAWTWRNLALLALPVIAVLVWLAHDEPTLKYPLTPAEFAPGFPGAERSYAVLMRYSKQTPSEEAVAFAQRRWTVTNAGWASIKEPEKRLEFVAANRAALEADWVLMAPQRSWIEELNAFERIGDLTPPRHDADILTFAVWRSFSQQSCAMALLQAADGHGDEAIATVLPVLECGRKLQRDSRILVRSMIGVVLERMAVETAGTVLDHAVVSPAMRARLAAAIARNNPPAEARRLILMEYAIFTPELLRAVREGEVVFTLRDEWTWLRGPLKWLGRLVINPNATVNLIGENTFQVAAFAEAREVDKIDALTRKQSETFWYKPGMKNLGGQLVAVMATPAYGRLTERYWKMVDLRADLRRRLAPAVAAK